MARIETYPEDGNISVNDFVLGSDGDKLNATKNYRLLKFLDYLGTQYNLNSTDLLFDYNNVTSGSVGDGQVSTNNYADGTILMSGVTNIYVSKVTAFGQLVDDILNIIGDEGLSIMFTDMGNRNNLGIFTVNSTVDVDSNTINMSVTATTSVGNLTVGKVMGIRIGIGGSGGGTTTFLGLSDTPSSYEGKAGQSPYVNPTEDGLLFKSFIDTTSTQSFSGIKTAMNPFNIRDSIIYDVDSSVGGYASGGSTGYEAASKYYFTKHTNAIRGIFDFSGITVNRTYTLQDKSGTIAHLDDVPLVTSGTFIPTVEDSDGAGTYTIGFSNCTYTRIGKQITISVRLTSITTTGTPTGYFRIILPPPLVAAGSNFACAISQIYGLGFDFYSMSAQINSGSSAITFSAKTTLDSSIGQTNLTGVVTTSGAISFSLTYITT